MCLEVHLLVCLHLRVKKKQNNTCSDPRPVWAVLMWRNIMGTLLSVGTSVCPFLSNTFLNVLTLIDTLKKIAQRMEENVGEKKAL